MIKRFRWWLYTHLPTHWIYTWFKIDCSFLLPKVSSRKSRRVAPPVIGIEKVSVESELYFRPDKPPNPAKMWNKFARNCEKYEDEGRIPKVDDHVDWAIEAWKQAGYET